MNRIQKVFFVIYFLFIAAVCVYVPWKVNIAIAQSTVIFDSIGYSPIWTIHTFSIAYEGALIDFPKVILEIIGITAIFAIPFVLLRGRRAREIEPESEEELTAIEPEHEEETNK
jgi:hypothetical protein